MNSHALDTSITATTAAEADVAHFKSCEVRDLTLPEIVMIGGGENAVNFL